MSRVAAIGIIYKNSVLLCRRVEFWEGKPVPLGGFWSIFAGSIEKGESPIFCAIRELKEESQIEVSVENVKYVKTLYGDNDFTMHIYMSEVDELIDPILNAEHTEYGWFNIDDLDHFPYDIDAKIIECIKKYKRNRFLS